MKFRRKKALKVLVMSALMAGISATSMAAVGVVQGPTPIDQGMANSAEDFTIYNDKIAASFAVGSNNYWNMTTGSILDIAMMKDGKFGTDLTNDIEFLNDYWTATGSWNGEDLLHTPIKDITYKLEGDKKVTVTAKTRYWTEGHKMPLNVTIQYTLEDGKNYIDMKTVVENPAGNDAYLNMNSGYSLSTLAVNMFGPFGFYPDVKRTGIRINEDPEVNTKYGDFVVTYGKNYAVAVNTDHANAYKGSSGYKDVYVNRDILPGQSYTYTGEILVIPNGETAPVIERKIQKDPSIKSGVIEGIVRDPNGKPLPNAYVIFNKPGSYKKTMKSDGVDQVMKDIMQPFVWKITDKDGKYKVTLPQDRYDIYVQSQGTTPSDVQHIDLKGNTVADFQVKPGAKAALTAVDEKGKPVDFKVVVTGIKSDVKGLGGSVYFTDPATHKADFDVSAPENELTFTAYHGADYTSKPVEFKTFVKGGQTVQHQFVIPQLIHPEKTGWYGNDNHQHADHGDGATTVPELFAAQMAAGLDLNLVLDHDYIGNIKPMRELANQYNRPFIPNVEVSPGWGHWGFLMVNDKMPCPDPSLTPGEIIQQGHDRDALVVMHHPFTDYGFLTNRAGVKGGNDPSAENFEFLELQSTMDLSNAKNMDKRTLDVAEGYWNRGIKKYLSAGSDQHDATSNLYPGIIRMYSHVDGKLTGRKFVNAMAEGKAYVTMGPIFTPAERSMFGTTQQTAADGTYTFETKVQAVNGLKEVQVVSEGKPVETKTFDNTTDPVSIQVKVKPEHDTWVNVIAKDGKDHYAVSNPVWVKVKK